MLRSESFAGPPGWLLCEHFVVPCVLPYRLDLTVAVLRRTSLNPVDVLDAQGRYLRAFAGSTGLRVCVAHQLPDTNTLHVALYLPDDERKAPNEDLRMCIPRMLGTGVNLSGFYTVAAKVPELALLALQARGVKPPHYPSLWEALCNAVVFQQVSLESAMATMRRVIALGFVVSFVVGFIVVRTLLDFVSKHGFAPFAWWRIVVGIAGRLDVCQYIFPTTGAEYGALAPEAGGGVKGALSTRVTLNTGRAGVVSDAEGSSRTSSGKAVKRSIKLASVVPTGTYCCTVCTGVPASGLDIVALVLGMVWMFSQMGISGTTTARPRKMV